MLKLSLIHILVAFNGSHKVQGNTYDSINAVAEELRKENIQVEIINVGSKSIRGCACCGGCSKNKDHRCVINDEVNEWALKMKEADGIILGSPVYYAGLNGNMKSFLDRAFMISGANGGFLRHKVGASVAVARRAGSVGTVDEMNKFISFTEMIMPTSNYWPVVYLSLIHILNNKKIVVYISQSESVFDIVDSVIRINDVSVLEEKNRIENKCKA